MVRESIFSFLFQDFGPSTGNPREESKARWQKGLSEQGLKSVQVELDRRDGCADSLEDDNVGKTRRRETTFLKYLNLKRFFLPYDREGSDGPLEDIF